HQAPAGVAGADEHAHRWQQRPEEQVQDVVGAVALLIPANFGPGLVWAGHQREKVGDHGVFLLPRMAWPRRSPWLAFPFRTADAPRVSPRRRGKQRRGPPDGGPVDTSGESG